MTDFGKAKMADANFPIALYKEGQSKSNQQKKTKSNNLIDDVSTGWSLQIYQQSQNMLVIEAGIKGAVLLSQEERKQ